MFVCVCLCVCLVLPKTRSADTGRTRTLLYRYWQPPINNQRTIARVLFSDSKRCLYDFIVRKKRQKTKTKTNNIQENRLHYGEKKTGTDKNMHLRCYIYISFRTLYGVRAIGRAPSHAYSPSSIPLAKTKRQNNFSLGHFCTKISRNAIGCIGWDRQTCETNGSSCSYCLQLRIW